MVIVPVSLIFFSVPVSSCAFAPIATEPSEPAPANATTKREILGLLIFVLTFCTLLGKSKISLAKRPCSEDVDETRVRRGLLRVNPRCRMRDSTAGVIPQFHRRPCRSEIAFGHASTAMAEYSN